MISALLFIPLTLQTEIFPLLLPHITDLQLEDDEAAPRQRLNFLGVFSYLWIGFKDCEEEPEEERGRELLSWEFDGQRASLAAL